MKATLIIKDISSEKVDIFEKGGFSFIETEEKNGLLNGTVEIPEGRLGEFAGILKRITWNS